MSKDSEEVWEERPLEKKPTYLDKGAYGASLIRKVKVSHSGRNQLIRIPKEITDILEIKKGDDFVFEIKLDKQGKPKKNTFLIRQNETP